MDAIANLLAFPGFGRTGVEDFYIYSVGVKSKQHLPFRRMSLFEG